MTPTETPCELIQLIINETETAFRDAQTAVSKAAIKLKDACYSAGQLKNRLAQLKPTLDFVERFDRDWQLEFPGVQKAPCDHKYVVGATGTIYCFKCNDELMEVPQLADLRDTLTGAPAPTTAEERRDVIAAAIVAGNAKETRNAVADREEAAAVVAVAPETTEETSEPTSAPQTPEEPRVTGKLATALQETGKRVRRTRTAVA